ncbi:MAG: LptA/OstA family protein [Verrucomicrobiota bacterium]|nr:LptA/OstA family protein [Verrucomicrobiota bacterium]
MGIFQSSMGQIAVKGRIQDFRVPTTDPAGKKALFTGKDARSAGNNLFEIISPHLETFTAGGKPDMIVDSPRSFYDQQRNDAYSDAELTVRSADGKFSIQGRGWQWSSARSILTISNAVEGVIRRSALNDAALVGSGKSNQLVTIRADRLEYHPEKAIFSGTVRVVDEQGTLEAEILTAVMEPEASGIRELIAEEKVALAQGDREARSGRAVYTLSDRVLRLTEKPTWQLGERFGSCEILILEQTNNLFRAEQNVYMRLPVKEVITNSVMRAGEGRGEQFLEVNADRFEFRDLKTRSIAIYEGNVAARELNRRLECELLTLHFMASNRLSQIVAEKGVSLWQGEDHAMGERAVYDFGDGRIELIGNPKWEMRNVQGRSETLVMWSKEERIEAGGKVEMILQGRNSLPFDLLPNGNTNRTRTTTDSPIHVRSARFVQSGKLFEFFENVRVNDARGQIDCASLSVQTGASNQVERVVAEGDVIVTQENSQVIGQRAVYSAGEGEVVITGSPKIMTPDREVIAPRFVLNRTSGRFRFDAPYRITMRRASSRKE